MRGIEAPQKAKVSRQTWDPLGTFVFSFGPAELSFASKLSIPLLLLYTSPHVKHISLDK